MHVNVWMCMWKQKQDARCLPMTLLLITLRQGLSLNEKITISTKLAGQKTLSICLSLIHSAGAPGRPSNAWLFMCRLGAQT